MLAINKEKLINALANEELTIKELSVKAKLSRTVISNLLNGNTEVARPATVGKLAKALNVKVEDLLEEEG